MLATIAIAAGVFMFVIATAAEARRGGGVSRGGGGMGRSVSRGPRVAHRPAVRHAPRHVNRAHRPIAAQPKIHRNQPALRNTPRNVANLPRNAGPNRPAGPNKGLAPGAKMQQLAANQVHRNLPINKAVAGNAIARGRIAVPPNIRPRITLAKAPGVQFHARFAPFIQRQWRRAFFWAAIAGIGYVTIPQLYYDRFYACVNGAEPDFGCAADILSVAAYEEESAAPRERYPMPTGAAYRYSAKIAPPKGDKCSFDAFVERKWNRAFVWVQIPGVGNVTVPESHYDNFYSLIGQEPPNYEAGCKLLAEALVADTVVEG